MREHKRERVLFTLKNNGKWIKFKVSTNIKTGRFTVKELATTAFEATNGYSK